MSTYLAHLDPLNAEADRIADERADCESVVKRINAALDKCDLLDGWITARVGEREGVYRTHSVIELVDDSEAGGKVLDWWCRTQDADDEWRMVLRHYLDELLAPVMEGQG